MTAAAAVPVFHLTDELRVGRLMEARAAAAADPGLEARVRRGRVRPVSLPCAARPILAPT